MITILTGDQLRTELPKLCGQSNQIRIAVAFWGEGAEDRLGLAQPFNKVSLVCNLRMGGTNPRIIKALLDGGADVRHLDKLHAKLYLFDTHAVIGSSNVSANGLSLQSDETTGWIEANLLFDRAGPYDDAVRLFNEIWKQAKRVTDEDIASAQEVWSRRRRIGPVQDPKYSDLLEAMQSKPLLFADKRIFLTVDTGWEPPPKVISAFEKEQERAGVKDLDFWTGWDDMPDNATFISFLRGPNGGLRFYGFSLSPEERWEVQASRGEKLQIVRQIKDVQGLRKVGSLSVWRKIVDQLPEDVDCMELGQVVRELLPVVNKKASLVPARKVR